MFITAEDSVRLHAIAGPPAGVPLVLSNSLGTDVGLWDRQLNAFNDTHSVWRYDTRGHGRSDVPPAESSIEQFGHDLIAIIDATGRAPVDICGLSIGGITALWVAIHAPQKVRRIVLANTGAKIGHLELWKERIRTARSEGMAVLAQASMQRWFTEGFRNRRSDVVDRFRNTFEGTSVEGYVSCCAALRDADLRALAPKVSCPTLVVTGAFDPATPPADGRWIADQIRGARVVELRAAHLSNVECDVEFNAAVRDFLTS